MKKIFILIIAFLTNVNWSEAQKFNTNGEAIVGQPCPDLYFNKTINFNKPAFYLHELKGKWVVLDLWSQHCVSCIASFPRISELQRKYADKVQFLMGTYDDPEGKHRQIYTATNGKLHLQMPCVFKGAGEQGQDDLFPQLKVGALPFVIIIDPLGIVKAVTGTSINEEQLKALFAGKTPVFTSAGYSDERVKATEIVYDKLIPFLVNQNGGLATSFKFRSLLSEFDVHSKYNSDEAYFFPPFYKGGEPYRLEGIGFDLRSLYRMAYLGAFLEKQIIQQYRPNLDSLTYPNPILKMTDTSQFAANIATGKNLFNYSSTVPHERFSKEFIMQIMQDDLKHYFNYDASMETQKMPFYSLVIDNPDLARQLATKGGKTTAEDIGRWLGIKCSNITMDRFCKTVRGFAAIGPRLFIDETGIKTNIDVEFEAAYGSLKSTNEALVKLGLKIVKKEREMKVLVIRAPIPLQTQNSN
jgi:thiol-disulfide isomerase/thioredoxin